MKSKAYEEGFKDGAIYMGWVCIVVMGLSSMLLFGIWDAGLEKEPRNICEKLGPNWDHELFIAPRGLFNSTSSAFKCVFESNEPEVSKDYKRECFWIYKEDGNWKKGKEC